MPKVVENMQLGFAGCRTAFRRCCRWLTCSGSVPGREPRDQYEVLCLGLTGAGKSTALATLVGEPWDALEPTTGFNIKTLPVNDTVLNIKELGGSVRPFWQEYFGDAHGVLFVLDAAASEGSLQESRQTLAEVLPQLKGRPCVVLATHADLSGCATQTQVEQLLEGLMHGRKSAVLSCSRGQRQEVLKALEMLTGYMTASIK
ncbi:ADP-ribosylation factor-like protein 15 [Rhipicephalus microplus]|uniref:ADP-ribosylation factor-like protein 15 n=1 Tax=Rhipicephalus microplus TaxID=6941 RepID=UPI0023768855